MVSNDRILLTGATGYVGGTVLDRLLKRQEPSLKGLTVDLLVRNEDVAAKLRDAYGDRVNPIIWPGGLTNIPFITETAANYNLIINTGSGFVPEGARAFVQGLARNVGEGKPAPWILHISGCTNISDRPVTGKAFPGREWDDANGREVFEFIAAEDAADPYPQRSAEVAVLTAGEETGVQAVSLTTPCIFGEGTGLFNTQGLVVPALMRYALKNGYGFRLNDTASFDWVHVEDLADMYILLTKLILEREDRGVGYIPSGKSGIIFPAVGRETKVDMMKRCLDVVFDAGVLPRDDTPKEKELRDVSLQEIADEITAGVLSIAERGWAGHKDMKATVARRLGWEPRHLDEAWHKDFVDELAALREGRRGNTMESCIAQKG